MWDRSRVKVQKEEDYIRTPLIDEVFYKNFESNDNEENNSLLKGKIGYILVNSGIVTEDQLNDALKTKAISGGRIGEVMVKKG